MSGKNATVLAYQKKHIKQYGFSINRKYDTDILQWMDGIENKQGYIKELIRADMRKSRS